VPLAFLTVFIVVTAQWPTGVISILSGFLLGTFAGRLAKVPEPWRLRHTWPAIVLIVATGAVTSGLTGNLGGIEVGAYHFKADALSITSDGTFGKLGESADLVYLWDCRNAGYVLGIAKNEIVGFQTTRAKDGSVTQQTLFDLIVRKKAIAVGFQPPC